MEVNMVLVRLLLRTCARRPQHATVLGDGVPKIWWQANALTWLQSRVSRKLGY
jgi:hypothetical protein